MFRREELVLIKKRALRRKVWFRVLEQAERALIDLTIRVVDTVRSSRLARVLSKPIEKIREAINNVIDRAREIGRPLAEKFSRVAQVWGNKQAKLWAEDESYAIYLGLSVLNKPLGLYS